MQFGGLDGIGRKETFKLLCGISSLIFFLKHIITSKALFGFKKNYLTKTKAIVKNKEE